MKFKTVFVILFSFVFLLCTSTIEAKSRQKKRPRRRVVVVKPDPPRPIELDPHVKEFNRIKQNEIADKLNMPIMWDEDVIGQLTKPLAERKSSRLLDVPYQLVPTRGGKHYGVKNTYTYPWINEFWKKFGEEQYSATGRNIFANSFLRTFARQRDMTIKYKYVRTRRGKLKKVRNKNYNSHAAEFYDDDGQLRPELISLHVKALAFDISRKNLTLAQIEWIRAKLIELKKQDIGVFPIEEQTESSKKRNIYIINCFHVVVFDPVAYQEYKASLTKPPAAQP